MLISWFDYSARNQQGRNRTTSACLGGRSRQPRAGRRRFPGDAHLALATLTRSSSFPCGVGILIANTDCWYVQCIAAVFFSWFAHVISDSNHTNQRLESAPPPEGKATPCPRRHPARPEDINMKQQLPLCARPAVLS